MMQSPNALQDDNTRAQTEDDYARLPACWAELSQANFLISSSSSYIRTISG